jgi:hypothetical protein
MATETKFTYEQVSLAVREASNTAYEMGQLESEQRIIKFLESMQLHPAKPSLDLIIERLRGGIK